MASNHHFEEINTLINRVNGCGRSDCGCRDNRRHCICFDSPKGEKGERGERGPRGERGERGERGPAGVPETSVALSAHNLSEPTIHVHSDGTAIELPHITYGNGFRVDSDSDTFEVEKEGFYYISYEIYTNGCKCISAAVYLNGCPIPSTIIHPSNTNSYVDSTIIHLCKGDTLELDLFGSNTDIHLQPGSAANFNVYKLS